ncbi:MAG: nitroreductase family deazaflavin-dependent oxidoreductase, partial [Gammaproteobacteria bacterium]|nr:nitroreductase family deazaflavin-dependent oxidoreductase [Gammaproteobacteria bacterium]
MMDWKLLNRNVIEEFRINSGRVAQFGDLPVVILNTIGAKTGNLLEVPLITVIDVEFKTEVFRANLTELDGQ